jgi:hypothetical protein
VHILINVIEGKILLRRINALKPSGITCPIYLNNLKRCILHLRFLYGSRCKQRLFP